MQILKLNLGLLFCFISIIGFGQLDDGKYFTTDKKFSKKELIIKNVGQKGMLISGGFKFIGSGKATLSDEKATKYEGADHTYNGLDGAAYDIFILVEDKNIILHVYQNKGGIIEAVYPIAKDKNLLSKFSKSELIQMAEDLREPEVVEPGMINKEIEQGIADEFLKYDGYSVKKVIIKSDEWNYLRNDEGVILGRMVTAYVYVQDNNSKCTRRYGRFAQKYDGVNYKTIYLDYTFSSKPFSCNYLE